MPQVTGTVICPGCHGQKSPERALCAHCGTKSCANGHLISQDSNTCHQCGWQEPQQKPSATTVPNIAADDISAVNDRTIYFMCPRCKTKIDNKEGRCPGCGFLGPV